MSLTELMFALEGFKCLLLHKFTLIAPRHKGNMKFNWFIVVTHDCIE